MLAVALVHVMSLIAFHFGRDETGVERGQTCKTFGVSKATMPRRR